jgi:hypothetical protein
MGGQILFVISDLGLPIFSRKSKGELSESSALMGGQFRLRNVDCGVRNWEDRRLEINTSSPKVTRVIAIRKEFINRERGCYKVAVALYFGRKGLPCQSTTFKI